jgi:hypothetical protein
MTQCRWRIADADSSGEWNCQAEEGEPHIPPPAERARTRGNWFDPLAASKPLQNLPGAVPTTFFDVLRELEAPPELRSEWWGR